MIPLKDLQDLLDKSDTYRPGRGIPEPPDEEEVARCIQVLMSRQCIYPHQTHLARSYNIMAHHEYQEFFRRYFNAMGLEFHFDPRSRMVALRVYGIEKKRYDWQATRLKKDETLILYALKLAYEEGFRDNRMGPAGDVEISSDELIDSLDTIGRLQIEEARLLQVLKLFERKGVLQIGELDPVERVRLLTLLPGIEVACPEVYMEAVALWAEQQPQSDGPSAGQEIAGDTDSEEQAHV
jgi:hypothetical protein